MLALLIIAAYLVIMVLTMRITLRWLISGTEVDGDDWFIVIIAGVFWPIALVCFLFYIAGKRLIRPLVIPSAVRRAERARKLREREEANHQADMKARRQAREHGLPYPGDTDG